MSGAAGGTRIPRSAVEQTVKDYTDNILSRIEGFKDAKLSGSFNRPEKEDFGDIDIIVTIETDRTKKEVKKAIADLFQSLPDEELPPLQNPRYKGKKFINHGEMVSNLYPISGMPGEFVQVDNIISLSQEEGEFKKTVLDYPAELQGLILGLVKTPLLEEDPEAVFSRLGIKDIPKAGKDQEYEFHIDTSDLTLRLVTYGESYRILNSNTVWQSKDFNDVQTLLKDYDLKGSFEDIIAKVKTLKNERSKNRVKGFFKKSIKVGAAEKDTPKGDTKQRALDAVAQLEESYRSKARNGLRAQYLEEEEKTRTAIFPGAFKPPHKDHINRIIAASEKVGNEGKVIVLVSPSTRAKDGQEAISAEQSLRVFNILKDKDIIPSNVNIIISPEKSPVLAAYKEFEANKDQPYIAVFGKDDKARFKNIDEKLPNVEVNSFESAGIGNTSATDLRIALLNRDKSEVEKYIPVGITADEYIDALGLAEEVREEVIVEDTDAAADLWEPHAAMLDRMKNQPDLLKGLWKGLSKPSRRALVLYYRRKKTQTENVIPQDQEKAAPYGSGYTLVDEGLWANINAKKKAGKKTSHKNSNAYKDAKKAGDALEKTKGLEENKGEKKLRVFDFDDTLVHVDATIHITHKDGTKSGLTPAEYAVYVPKEGDTFNFSEFSSVIKKAKPLKDNIQDLIKSYNDPTEKTTILTARLLGYPVKKYLKDEFNIEPYVVGLGSSDPKDKSRWIEAQIKKGYNNIEFRDDSQKNVDAVAGLKDKYPEISIKSMLVENASYNRDNKVQYKIAELTDHMKAKGMKIEPLPAVEFVNGDNENARDFFGKTAYYDPASSTIVLYTEGRHPKDIVRSFAHEMIHHMQNLEGRLENITTTNTHEDDNLNDLEKEANLKGTMTFRNWTDSLNEANTTPELQKEKVNISFELFDGTKISEDITLAMSLNSQGLFELGDNIEKYSGLTLKDAQEFNETPDDAYIYGLVNTMNDGQDIFFWTNGTRLVGNVKKIGAQTAVIEQLAHEGVHLTRAILAKSLMGDGFPTEEWPSIGEQDNDTIEEEQLTTALSYVLEHITPSFIEMAKKYISKPKDKSLAENVLNEGGAYGHMNHPFDVDLGLTFSDLKIIIDKALNGKLEFTREKTDGQALAISWRADRGLIAARNKSHLKDRGLNALDIKGVSDKFANRGGLTDAYNFAMKDLENAIKGLSKAQREKVFKDGSKFMNIEVIWPESVNVIPYGQPLLVFHGTMEYDESGVAIGADTSDGRILAGMIKQVNADVQSKYTIQGPPVVTLPKNQELSKMKSKFFGQLSKIQKEFSLKDSAGVAEYHQKWWESFVDKNSPTTLDNKQKMGLVKRWAFYDKGLRLDKKVFSDEKTLEWAKKIDKQDHAKISKENIRKFEDIFLGVGSEVLSFMSSVLTVNPDKAIRDMKKRLDKTIKDVQNSGDSKKINKLKMELERLAAVGGKDKLVPNEGLVFLYKGHTMKLTGTFASLNQILGLMYF